MPSRAPNGVVGNCSFIDGIFVSRSLSTHISSVSISSDGDNVSDHYPVELDLSLNLTESHVQNLLNYLM